MKLFWSQRARADIEQLSAYYRQIDPDLSISMRRRLEAAPMRLLEFPKIGSRSVLEGCRKIRVRGSPYLLYYHVRGNELIIVRVIHSARDL